MTGADCDVVWSTSTCPCLVYRSVEVCDVVSLLIDVAWAECVSGCWEQVDEAECLGLLVALGVIG